MSFGVPLLLVTLLCVPVLLGVYVWQLRRRRRQAVRFSNVALLRAAGAGSASWRRHVPVALVLCALGLLGLASARPTVRAEVPTSSSTVIVALDVSGSMCATDVVPNRLAAAQAAVRSFVQGQDDQTKVGLVVFSGFAQLAVAPTVDREELLAALDAVTTGRGTTIGAAILRSIDAIAELDPNVAPADAVDEPTTDGPGVGEPSPTPTPTGGTGPGSGATAGKVGVAPEIVVLLTDGANTRGVTPGEAADQAAARGVRIYPIGFGTKNPTQMACTRDQYGGFQPRARDLSGFGGGTMGGRNFLVVDEAALKGVAQRTGGEYFAATDAQGLTKVLADLPKHVTVAEQDIDLSAAAALLAALVLLGGLAVSLRRLRG
ncbi:Ca-activated chloride channel family protein [Humibacillus xanthopallidus]|uniref:Ca-activated chloride channel family protein n=1 Tax=Humibacillus xanthopallidus TaxID=412689 RepID=A0A543PNI4_9MICO|nr:VWA domain-containing protein [Humibacillus xanthopallidus]TQN45645.1 Ca-activated chloride channel family protein [Humibacillus xanthopallidus]